MSQNLKAAKLIIEQEIEASEDLRESYLEDLSSKVTCNLAVISRFNSVSSELGISLSAGIILVYILENGHASAEQLNRIIGKNQKAVRDAFKKKGKSDIDSYLVRTGKEGDRRIKVYTLTKRGIECAASLKVIID